ncbi:MAG: CAP domain-containing protein [Actinomycetota bacterium]|nr:CAP domain-containing protein [Actinomycetota bacterium]
MIKRLASISLVALPLSLVLAGSASAQCTPGLLTTCSQPSSSPQPSFSPQPSSSPESQPAQQPAPEPAGTIAEEPGAAARILSLVNRDRAAAGLAPLESRGQIVSVAQGHSRDMAGRRTIWHNDAYFTDSTRRSLNARGLGENVAMNSSVDDAHRRLMASPGHRANILKDSFDAVGISVVHDEQGMFYVTQNFVDSAAPAEAPGVAQTPTPAKAAATRVPSPAPTVLAASKKPVAVVKPATAPQLEPPAPPAELDRAVEATAPSASVTEDSPSGPSVAGAIGGALAALVGALAALVRLG